MVGTNEHNMNTLKFSLKTEQMKVTIQHYNSQVEVKQKCNTVMISRKKHA